MLVQIPPYKYHTRSLHVVGASVVIVDGGTGVGSTVISSAVVGTSVTTSGGVGSAVKISGVVGSAVITLVGTSVTNSGEVGSAVIISAGVGSIVVTFVVGGVVSSIDDGWGVSLEQTSMYSHSPPSPNISLQHSARLSKKVKSSTALAGMSYPFVHWNVC